MTKEFTMLDAAEPAEETIHAQPAMTNSSLFVALSRFTVANNMSEDVRKAFGERPHLVDDVPGFVKLDVICTDDEPNEFWLITYWTDQTSYEIWPEGPLHRPSHAGIPRGLKIVRGSNQIRFFKHIAS